MTIQSKKECERARISVRNACNGTMIEPRKFIKEGLSEDLEKDDLGDVQKLMDAFSKKIDDLIL